MKKQTLTHFILIVLVSLISCVKQETWTEGKVVIKGKILNCKGNSNSRDINLILFDLMKNNMRTKISSSIDVNGNFIFDIPIQNPQEFYLEYEGLTNMICAPNDSIFIEIDSPNKSIKVVGGNRAIDNSHMQSFIKLYNPKRLRKEKIDAVKSKNKDEYKIYIHETYKRDKEQLDAFIKKNNTSDFFNLWANDFITYKATGDLLSYPNDIGWIKNVPEDSIKIKPDYFLDLYNMDDDNFISINHANFIHNLSRYYTKDYPKDTIKKAYNHFREGNIITGADILKSNIKNNTNGFTKDVLLTKFYYDAIAGKQLKEFEAIYDSIEIGNSYCKKYINTEFQELKRFMANQTTEGASLNSITENLIDSISSRFNGKVVYIDFWAPWCSPCMTQMPYAEELQDNYKDKDVAFVYLASRCSKESWRATIANKKLKGEHFLLTDEQYSTLESNFGITGIPHYVLINKSGNIVDKDAFRPSNKELLKVIDKLLLE